MTDTVPRRESPSPAPGAIVVARQLRKRFTISRPAREVLHGVNLTVARGEFVAIMGPSGCGKSTLLHILGGLEPPDTGSVEIEGVDLYGLHDRALAAYRRDHVGFVFQFFNLLPALTAAENIALPLRLRGEGGPFRRHGVSRRDITARVSALMDQLNLKGLQGHGPEEISGGEQQRVAIARALAPAPALLLADEPTGNLDWTTGHEVMALLARLCREQQQTIVLVTHDARIAGYADRVLVMRDGSVIDQVELARRGGADAIQPDLRALVARLSELDL